MPKRRLRHDASDQNPVSTTAGLCRGWACPEPRGASGLARRLPAPGRQCPDCWPQRRYFPAGAGDDYHRQDAARDDRRDDRQLEASGLPGMSGVDELHGARVLHLCAREFCPVVLDEPAVHRDADAHHEPLFRCGRSFHRILERLFEQVDVGLFDWPRNPRDRSPRKQTCQRPQHGRWRAGQRKIEPAKF